VSSSAISCRDLTVDLGGRRVLDGVSLDVPTGEWLNIVGPNGAGKSTFLRVLAALTPGQGQVTIMGREGAELSRRERSRLIGFVPQIPLLPTGMTVTEYVLLGRTAHLPPFGSESRHDLDLVADALDRLELRRFAGRMIDTLSGGERQRVLMARLLAQDAPIALLDEPTSALDIGHQQQVLDLIDELRRSHSLTVVATQHDLTLAGQYGDRVALLVDGRLVADGAARDVLSRASLERHYGARIRIIESEDGPIVLPVRDRQVTP
jgi:iron complex transport system ATP-binding protein